ncbi:MAG: UDP-N-acetylglucosamine--N-acetylmuramyl-(pentapeptide) pyrophosphoryl-undecaprenol N-acetylglucosamine transferase, partial [Chlamydiia bacterium]|nr:UDP-N-acetylglucosamine--N-acetylmuramyl-(pentapeptide) pyrophosphoryl-undecaprenol N-acetylglucosamine transferase [Chlamydiia bacterium]
MWKHKRLLIAAGGSGGHLFPAVRLAQTLKNRAEGVEICFIGGKLATSPFFTHGEFPFIDIPCATFSLKNPLAIPKGLIANCRGFLQSIRFLNTWKPDLIVGYGSYHSLPPLMATRFYRKPLYLFESNAVPGRVIRLCARWAAGTASLYPLAGKLRGPIRQVIMEGDSPSAAKYERAEAHRSYGLDPMRPTLLVFGGSQG